MSRFTFASLLKGILPARSTRGQRGRSRYRAALRIDHLEDRLVPAVTDMTTGTPYATIQDAVNGANPGDTILADPGMYFEHVTIDKPLTLQGAQHGMDARTRSVPSFQESIVSNAEGDFQIEADNVTIDGFTLQGVTSNPNTDPAALGAAIWTNPGFSGTHGGVRIVNNIIQDNIAGIELDNDGTSQAQVQFNLFRDNVQPGAGGGTDVEVNFGLSKALIDSNVFANTSFVEDAWALGVSAPSDHVTFSNNSVTNHGRGVYFYNTSDATVTGNTILGASHYAIGLFGNNGSPANSSFTIANNTLDAEGRGGAGLLFVNDTSASAYSGTLVVADAVGANVSATAGSAFTGVVAMFTDPTGTQAAGGYKATITWGDKDGSGNPLTSQGTIMDLGGGHFQVVGSHTYAGVGTYALSVSITAADSSTTNTSASATVGVAGPGALAQEQSTFTVPGTPNEVVLLRFRLLARHRAFRNEVGVFLVDDAQGRIAGLLPGNPHYLRRAVQLGRWQVLFRRGERAGSTLDVPFNGGARLMFDLVPNGGLRGVLRQNPRNRPGGKPVMLFADGRQNPDRVNHLRTSPLPDGVVLGWEDGVRGGHRDFNDVVFSVQPIRRLV
jgi:parallel beta-helix repeat protein